MKKIYFTLFLISCSLFVEAQAFEWVRTFGANGTDSANASVVDASGNVFTTGFFRGTFDADPGPGVTTLTGNAGGGIDFYITKFDASGNFVWAQKIGGSDFDQAYSMAVDSSGNIYLAGYFVYLVDFNPGAGVYNMGASMNYTAMGFLLKLDTNGNFLWAKQFTGNNTSTIVLTTVTVDASDNVFVGGYFKGPMAVDSEPVAFTSLSSSFDIFFAKFNNAGAFQWAKQIGSSASESVSGLATDASGNLYLAGNFNGLLDFDPSPVIQNLGTTGGTDAFLMKVDAAGNYQWATKVGGLGEDYGRSVSVGPSGEVFLAGNFNGTVNFTSTMPAYNITSNGGTDNFISKYESNGTYRWTRAFGSTGAEYISSLAFDTLGNVFSTGYFNGTVDFNPNSGTYNLTSNNLDVFILKLTTDGGDFVNATRFGGSGNEQGNFIKVDANNKIITTGNFSGDCYFNPNSSSTDHVLSAGGDDGFVHKMMDPTLGTSDSDIAEKAFTVYPNPNNGRFNINLEEEAKITIVNVLGQIVLEESMRLGNNLVNLQDKANGIYFVTIDNDSSRTFKMVKQ